VLLSHIGLVKDHGSYLVNHSRYSLFYKCWKTTVGNKITQLEKQTEHGEEKLQMKRACPMRTLATTPQRYVRDLPLAFKVSPCFDSQTFRVNLANFTSPKFSKIWKELWAFKTKMQLFARRTFLELWHIFCRLPRYFEQNHSFQGPTGWWRFVLGLRRMVHILQEVRVSSPRVRLPGWKHTRGLLETGQIQHNLKNWSYVYLSRLSARLYYHPLQ